MSSLSGKSAEEISELLDEFGIKHGPVVDSTRSLYEKKIKEAMAKEKGGKASQPSSDKTYYREEEEEVTYVYRTPVRNDVAGGDRMSNLRSRSEWSEREYEPELSYSASHLSSQPRFRTDYQGRDAVDARDMYDTPASYRSSYLQSTPVKAAAVAPEAAKSSRLIPMWVQLVVFLALAFFLYLVFSSMEPDESHKGIE